MPEGTNYDLAVYRLEKAQSCMEDARILFENGGLAAAANRAYYAVFRSARAVMAIDGEDKKRHSGVIAYFQEHYIKSGVFEKEYSYILQNAFEIRQEADYEDFYVISKDETVRQLGNAQKFTDRIRAYVTNLK